MQDGRKDSTEIFNNECTQAPISKTRKLTTLRRAIFVAIVAIVCFSAIGGYVLQRAFPDIIPEPKLASKQQSSEIDETTLLTTAEIKADPIGALLSGAIANKLEAQVVDKNENKIENTLNVSIPNHDYLLLTNASIQRTGIKTANLLACYEAYPTYYGSEHFEDPELGILGYITESQDAVDVECYELWADGVNHVASANPNVRFAFCQTYTARQSWYSPTYDLVSNPVSRQYMIDHVIGKLDSNVLAVKDDFQCEEDYLTGWFNTDHHWTPERAMASYRLLANALGWRNVEADFTNEVTSSWYGSFSRLALDLEYDSTMLDSLLRFDALEWSDSHEETGVLGNRDAVLDGSFSYTDGSYGVYDSYFGSTNCEAKNYADDAQGICIVICNSMARALKESIASNYTLTIFRDPDNTEQDKTLQELIDTYNPDDIVFILTPGSTSIKTYSSGIFE